MTTKCANTTAVLLDIDGTLLDSNDAHAHAWIDAFASAGKEVGYERVRPLIGMGGDKLLSELFGLVETDPLATQMSDERKRRFLDHYLPSLRPTLGARKLL